MSYLLNAIDGKTFTELSSTHNLTSNEHTKYAELEVLTAPCSVEEGVVS